MNEYWRILLVLLAVVTVPPNYLLGESELLRPFWIICWSLVAWFEGCEEMVLRAQLEKKTVLGIK